MRSIFLMAFVCAGCAVRLVPTSSAVPAAFPPGASAPPALEPPPVSVESPEPAGRLPEEAAAGPEPSAAAVPVPAAGAARLAASVPATSVPATSDGEEGEGEEGEGEEDEALEDGAGTAAPDLLWTAELSDQELAERWKNAPASLGSVSVGFVGSGRLVNGVRFPEGADWIVTSPGNAWATEETIGYLSGAIRQVRARHPHAPLLRVNGISAREGGYLRPHKSHQNGRDVDLGFYYPNGETVLARERERYIDPALNWALVRALVTETDVQMILVDSRIQKVLYDHALGAGEDKAWLDSLFHAGADSIVKHARRHRDHFHVRFYNPRAQEMGRRLAPLLALQPEHNVAMHRVRSGDTLGAIALRYGSTVASIQKASRLKGTFLRLGQVLSIPLRGPCTRCPVPPAVMVPPRRLPPVDREPIAASLPLPEALAAAVHSRVFARAQ